MSISLQQTSLFPDITACADKIRKPQTSRFYSDIRAEYKRLSSIKKEGVKKYSEEYIIATLSAQFYRSSRTIENIVYFRV